jgi:hypothetical protein
LTFGYVFHFAGMNLSGISDAAQGWVTTELLTAAINTQTAR